MAESDVVIERRARLESGRRATSPETFDTLAGALPYCVHGNPSRRTRAGCPSRTRPSAADGAKSATTFRTPSGTIVQIRSPGLHHAADFERRDLGQRAGNRRAHLPLFDLVVEPIGRGDRFAAPAFDDGDFVLEARDASQAILFPGVQIARQRGCAANSAARASLCRSSASFRPRSASRSLTRPRRCRSGSRLGFFDGELGC